MKVRSTIILSFWMLTCFSTRAQSKDSMLPSIRWEQVLSNINEKNNTWRVDGAELYVLDFFGTWCVPCIKALPKLDSLQTFFGPKIKIWLIANESDEKLQSFLSKRPSLQLPIVVDRSGKLNTLFSPPSYPYTVVLNATGKIISITNGSSLSKETLQEWMASKTLPETSVAPPTNYPSLNKLMINSTKSTNQLVRISQDLVYAAKTDEPTSSFLQQLKEISAQSLEQELNTDALKKAFWINLYNALVQIQLKQDSSLYQKRSQFFRMKTLEIGEEKWSLDDIEHGILRKSSIKYSLGYMKKCWPRKIEKRNRVNKVDPRIHFALNCGAASCPPIAFYSDSNIDQQLEVATTNYLNSEASYDPASNTLQLPALMSWFRGDFGNKEQRLNYVRILGILPATKHPNITYKKYDWSLQLKNYQK